MVERGRMGKLEESSFGGQDGGARVFETLVALQSRGLALMRLMADSPTAEASYRVSASCC